MLEYLRKLLSGSSNLQEIAEQTNIDVEELRQFTNGISILSGYDLDQLASYFRLELRFAEYSNLLPFERDASFGIQHTFPTAFSDATTVFHLALLTIGFNPNGSGELREITKRKGLTPEVVQLCLGLYTKALKHFRAVIALCELGLGEDANVAARALFEATLPIHFILRPTVRLKQNGKAVKSVGGKHALICGKCHNVIKPGQAAVKLKRLGTVMRAKLYMAHAVLEIERELKAYKDNKLNIPKEIFESEQVVKQNADRARKKIGLGWARRQKESGTFSGLSVRNLADSYKLLHFYLTVYRHQSQVVHGMNLSAYLQFDEQGRLRLNLGPSPVSIEIVLLLATVHVAGTMQVFNERLGLGFDTKINFLMRYLDAKAKE